MGQGNLAQTLREIQKSYWKSLDPPTQNHRNPREIQKSHTPFQAVSDPSQQHQVTVKNELHIPQIHFNFVSSKETYHHVLGAGTNIQSIIMHLMMYAFNIKSDGNTKYKEQNRPTQSMGMSITTNKRHVYGLDAQISFQIWSRGSTYSCSQRL